MKVSPFTNEPIEDFSLPKHKKSMEEAIQKVERQFGKEYDMVIGGKHIKTKTKITSYNPSALDEVVGTAQSASVTHLEQAISAATTAFTSWRHVHPEKRAEYLFKVAKLMKQRKMELSTLMVLEVGKNWVEAVADTCEAIDFLEFYGREMLRLSQPYKLNPSAGEHNEYRYLPLGVGVVIAPWNFPLAILAGMTMACVVTGNTVVMKPASATPVVAAWFMNILEEIGLPSGVVNFVTFEGGALGDMLVRHPKVRFINFTGSKDVGVGIVEKAAKLSPGQIWIKRVAAEMGGKNALIVDAGVDIDLAVEAAAVSAYGFQGQKCSALSRLIVVGKQHDELLEKLIERTKKITIGPVKMQQNYLGPVFSASAREKILKYIQIGKKEAKLVIGGKALDMPGYFLEPTIFAGVKSSHRIAQEEIFGPVLSVMKVKDFDEAVRVANDTQYGLTGGIISNNKKNIQKVKDEFMIGNMYINRKITGSIVNVQPFGGYNMSGTCAKAGGPDYLQLFLQGQSISEWVL